MCKIVKSLLCCFCVMVPCVVNALPAVGGAEVRSAKKSLLKPTSFAKTVNDLSMDDKNAIMAESYEPYYGFTAYQFIKLIEQEEVAYAAMENIEACADGDSVACDRVRQNDEGVAEVNSGATGQESPDGSNADDGTNSGTVGLLPNSANSDAGYCAVRHPHYSAGQKIPLGMPIDLELLSSKPGVIPWLIQAYRMGRFIPYGCRLLPEYYNQPDVECSAETKRPHKGVDVGMGRFFYQTPVFATADGVVERAKATNGSAGKYIKIDHGNNFKTLYMHLDQILVSPGQRVSAGCVIGYMGHTGGNADQTNPSMEINMTHLHYEIHYNGTAHVINAPDGGVVSIVRRDPDCPQNCETEQRKFYPAIKPNDFMTYYENRR